MVRRALQPLSAAVVAATIIFAAADPGGADHIPIIHPPTTTSSTTTTTAPPPPPQEPAPSQQQQQASQYPPLPGGSGAGRRVVYSVSAQRVWLVEADETVVNSWLVSGRRGTPRPGFYKVFSRSRWARAPSRVRMEFMVRFVRTRGLPIGFHAIPINRKGRPIQSEAQLGTYRSKGCVRQARSNAEFLWNWAPVGTPVTVTA